MRMGSAQPLRATELEVTEPSRRKIELRCLKLLRCVADGGLYLYDLRIADLLEHLTFCLEQVPIRSKIELSLKNCFNFQRCQSLRDGLRARGWRLHLRLIDLPYGWHGALP